jgi:hypothetical protein
VLEIACKKLDYVIINCEIMEKWVASGVGDLDNVDWGAGDCMYKKPDYVIINCEIMEKWVASGVDDTDNGNQ